MKPAIVGWFARMCRGSIVAAVIVSITCLPTTSKAQLLVADPVNLIENAATAIQTLATYKTQYEWYMESIEEFTDWDWDYIENGITEMTDSFEFVESFMGSYGGIDAFLENFQDVPFYRATACFNGTDECSSARVAELLKADILGIEASKQANDRVFKSISQQQKGLERDSKSLKKMQDSMSKGDTRGEKQLLSAAAQFASQSSNQLMQIRGLLISQQQMQTTQAQLEQNKQAKDAALEEHMKSGEYEEKGNVVPW